MKDIEGEKESFCTMRITDVLTVVSGTDNANCITMSMSYAVLLDLFFHSEICVYLCVHSVCDWCTNVQIYRKRDTRENLSYPAPLMSVFIKSKPNMNNPLELKKT